MANNGSPVTSPAFLPQLAQRSWMTGSPVPRFLSLVFLFFVAGTLIGYRSLNYPWYGDDVHLVRVYSTSEMAQAFKGNWDADNIETPGYRPLTVLFNSVRAAIFDDSLVAHRLFEIALLAAYLAVVARIALYFGMSYGSTVFAGFFVICTKNNWWNLVWISDAIHAFTGLLLALSALLSISAVIRYRAWKCLASILLAGVALFAREDALGWFPIIPLTGVIYSFFSHASSASDNDSRSAPFSADWRLDPRFAAIRLMLFEAAGLLVIALAFICLRSALIQGSQIQVVWEGWQMMLEWVFYPMGVTLHDVTPEFVFLLWLVAVGFLIGTNLFLVPRRARLMTYYWLGSVLILITPGLVEARGNLLLPASTFFSFGLAHMLAGVGTLSRRAFVAAAIVVSGVMIACAVHSKIAQLAAHPLSVDYLQANSNFLWGGKYSHAHVPPNRLESLRQQFASLGISSREEFEQFYATVEKQADDKDAPSGPAQGKPFWPKIDFMQP